MTKRYLAWAIEHDSHGPVIDTLVFMPEGDEPETEAKWVRLPWLDQVELGPVVTLEELLKGIQAPPRIDRPGLPKIHLACKREGGTGPCKCLDGCGACDSCGIWMESHQCRIHDARDTSGKCSCSEIVKALDGLLAEVERVFGEVSYDVEHVKACATASRAIRNMQRARGK